MSDLENKSISQLLILLLAKIIGYSIRSLIISIFLFLDIPLLDRLECFFGIDNLTFFQYFLGCLILDLFFKPITIENSK